MNEVAVTVQVPSELKILGDLAQSLVSQLASGASWMTVVSAALPVLFSESANFAELKAECKDPQAIVLGALVLGQVVAKLVADKAAAATSLVAEPTEPKAIEAQAQPAV